ncbi:MAG TPA: DUF4349 domain-containing protein [Flavisolibacter sp.]|nr:DUF4349 domain-containing protein [Flavisolibacter sp.]
MKSLIVLPAILLFIFLSGCENNSKETLSSTSLSDSTSVSGLSGDSVKLVKTAGINFKVKDVVQAVKSISDLTKKYGGMIYDQNIESSEGGRNELKVSADSLLVITAVTPQANVTARIPSDSLEAFIYNVANLGYFTGSNRMHIDDKSLDYLENALKQKNREDVLSRRGFRNNKLYPGLATIEVKDQQIEQRISNTKIDADVRYSTVDIGLFQNAVVRKEMIANYLIAGYQLSFEQRFSNACKDGWQYFLSFMIVVVQLWPFIIAALGTFIIYRYMQQKRRPEGANLRS